MKPDKKVLVYCQDMGGTKAIMPLLKKIDDGSIAVSYQFLMHELAIRALNEDGFQPNSLSTLSERMSQIMWQNYLREYGITHVLATLSSPYLDSSNAELFVACHQCAIPSLGFLDHWKGFDRFFDATGRLTYFPHLLGCPDAEVKSKVSKLGITEENCYVIGHPGLEAKMEHSDSSGKGGVPKTLLVVSQPRTREGFKGVFSFDGELSLKKIAGVATAAGYQVYYRPHPKEAFDGDLPSGVELDSTTSTSNAINKYGFFLGVDSMMLLEAYLAGKACFVYSENHEKTFPYQYGLAIREMKDLESALCMLQSHRDQDREKWRVLLRGSVQRAVNLFFRLQEL